MGRLATSFPSAFVGASTSSLVGEMISDAIAGSSGVSSAMLSSLAFLVGVLGPALVLQDWLGPSAGPAPSYLLGLLLLLELSLLFQLPVCWLTLGVSGLAA